MRATGAGDAQEAVAARRRSASLAFMDGLLLAEEREEPADLRLVGLAAVLADFEGLGELDARGRLAVALLQRLPEFRRLLPEDAAQLLADLLPPRRLAGRVLRDEVRRRVAAAFVELRLQRVEAVELLIDRPVDVDRDVGAEGIGLLELVLGVEEHGIRRQVRRVGAEEG